MTFHAWAIDTRSKDGHGFIGRYFYPESIPAHMEGCKVALFKTRELARQVAKEIRESKCSDGSNWSPFPEARVVRVEVTVRQVPSERRAMEVR